MTELPAGWTTHRPTLDDVPEILRLVHASDIAAVGEPDFTADEVREALTAFRDSDHRATDFETWRERWAAESSLSFDEWFVGVVDGEIAGVLQSSDSGGHGEGWVKYLAVLRAVGMHPRYEANIYERTVAAADQTSGEEVRVGRRRRSDT